MVADLSGDVRPLQVEKDETVANVKAVLEVEFGVPTDRQMLHFEGKMLTNEQKLSEAGVKDNDMLMMQVTSYFSTRISFTPSSSLSNSSTFARTKLCCAYFPVLPSSRPCKLRAQPLRARQQEQVPVQVQEEAVWVTCWGSSSTATLRIPCSVS